MNENQIVEACPPSYETGMPTTTTSSATAEPGVPLSIRLLRRANPVVRALLRSPLHRLASRDLLLLTYRGARSGRQLVLPLSYVEVEGALYLCTRSSRWWRSLRAHPEVELTLRGRQVAARATVVEPTSAEARTALGAFLTRNPRTGVLLYDVRSEHGRACEEDLVRETPRSVVVRMDRSAVPPARFG